MRVPPIAPLLIACAASLLVPNSALAAWGNNPLSSSIPICVASNEQYASNAISDGAGGAIVAWMDFRTGGADIYVQRVSAAGTMLWGTNGTPLCALPLTQSTPAILPDGAGGAFVAWADFRNNSHFDIYAQRVDASGTPLWVTDGVLVCAAAGNQLTPAIVSDGVGGFILAWSDARGGSTADVYAQRLSPDGTPRWTPNGVRLTAAADNQTGIVGTSDGNFGAVFAWNTTYDLFPPSQVFAQAVDSAGTIRWGSNGVAVRPPGAGAYDRRICAGGTGGAVLVWRTDAGTVEAQRLDANGAPLWGSAGNPVTLYTPPVSQSAASVSLAGDGAGGAFVGWTHGVSGAEDLSAQHLDALGSPTWLPAGVPVCTAAGRQSFDEIAADGAGGLVLAWSDQRAGSADIYTQRLDATGAAQWTPSGRAVCMAASAQYFSHLVPTVNGGWIVVWEDYRTGSTRDLYTQNVDRFGYLGDATPSLLSVSDVPGDEGGVVEVRWSRSYLDAGVNPVVVEYRLLRGTPDLPMPPGATLARTAGWELAATVPATGASIYLVPAPSDGDDVGGSHPITTYRVEAHSSPAGTGAQWSSLPVGGWSVDNLAPPAPTGFDGSYAAGAASMTWSASTAADFATHRLYRGSDPDFTPAPGNLIAETPGTSWVDPAGDVFHYRLTAVDIHGNESASALYSPTVVGVTPAAAASFALLAPWPNPVREACAIRFSVARDGDVRVTLFDTGGRHVATLHHGPLAAGPHVLSLAVDRAGGRRLSSGLYVLRLEAGGNVLTRRLVVTR